MRFPAGSGRGEKQPGAPARLVRRTLRASRKFLGAGLVGLTLTASGEEPLATGSTAVPEALWLRQPALAPDGRSIAFIYRGDLYRVDASGGLAQPLTRDAAQESHPVWSGDGSHIAFASNRNGSSDVFLISSEGGEPQRLTFGAGDEVPTAFSEDDAEVIFTGAIQDAPDCVLFPIASLSEVYAVDRTSLNLRQILTTPANLVRIQPGGNRLLYEDWKGYEDDFRKHQRSAVTRDVWVYDPATSRHTKLSDTPGEDRDPVWLPDGKVAWLTDLTGSLNIVVAEGIPGSPLRQLTHHTVHPVRHLSASASGDLCYTYDGAIHLLRNGSDQPERLRVQVSGESPEPEARRLTHSEGATEFALAPSGKEIAFIIRGDLFVVSTEHGITRTLTQTPSEERSPGFSPDGRRIYFAAEREGNWDLHVLELSREENETFHDAPLWRESRVLETPDDELQPRPSPDGRWLAYYHNRTEIRILELATDAVRTVLPGDSAYSYIDGDLSFVWSPDSRWIAATTSDENRWMLDITLVDTTGAQPPLNLTRSAFWDTQPKWGHSGGSLLYTSESEGNLPLSATSGEWERDVHAVFLNQEALDRFSLPVPAHERLLEREAKEKEKEESDEASVEKPAPQTRVETESLRERRRRLTLNTARLADYALSPDGETLYTLAKFEAGFDLWKHSIRKGEVDRLARLDATAAVLVLDEDGKYAYVLADGTLRRILTEDGTDEPIPFAAEQRLHPAREREAIFDHVTRLTALKFYDPALHGVDWKGLTDYYRQFLPHLSGGHDLAELLSEISGELNASHMGSGYRPESPRLDEIASLGILVDWAAAGPGVTIAEIIVGGPMASAGNRAVVGDRITEISGKKIDSYVDLQRALDQSAGEARLVTFFSPVRGTTWEQTIVPITATEFNERLYQRWVERRRADVVRLSEGRLGYVHIRGMDEESFRKTYDEVLGLHASAEGIVIDTRFNGGGNTSVALVEFFTGKLAFSYTPRGRPTGEEPSNRWLRPSILLVSESNYSDAHIFPVVYRQNQAGRIVGMPVPGTGTAVWWETQLEPALFYGIPQVGIRTPDGKLLENNQLEPDIRVPLEPEAAANGRDTQLESAVQELLRQLGTSAD